MLPLSLSIPMKRPDWDEYFLAIALLVSERSTCLRRKVGALIVKDKQILATGYNGAPTGVAHCEEVGCIRQQQKIPSGEKHELCRGLHAEQNAIIQAAYHGVSIRGSVLYVTCHPCSVCAKMIINAGIKKVTISESYPDLLAQRLLADGGVKVTLSTSASTAAKEDSHG